MSRAKIYRQTSLFYGNGITSIVADSFLK